ncbi:MAG: TonB-dependent receptor [bacterium]|nr:MAG: TonB-dependent receptor [bacterium]
MRHQASSILMPWFVILGVQLLFSQEPVDSLQSSRPQKELPQIQLQEYTIVGLAKISLPRKIRTQVFQDVDIEWSDNHNLYTKELPAITFQFSRVKPSLFQLYEFPWLNSKIHYGSYNEAGVMVNMQFKANRTLPYFSAQFLRSDGHLDNAQWTGVGLQAGVHHNFTAGHLLHVSTAYQADKRGIWRDYETYQQDWEVQTVFWDLNAALENRWNNSLITNLTGSFYLDEQENAFKYEDQGFNLLGTADFFIKETKLGFTGGYESIDISSAAGNLRQDSSDTELLSEYKSSILAGKFDITQPLTIAAVKAGVSYQKSTEKDVRSISEETEKEYINPFASVEIGMPGNIKFYGRYRPGAKIQRLRQNIRLIPFSDLNGLRVANYKSRWEAGFDLDVPYHINLSVISRFSTVENQATVVNPADSLTAVFDQGGYPGWIFGTVDETKIWELYGKIDWNVSSRMEILGWANYRQSDIRNAGVRTEIVQGNELPYFSKLGGYGHLRWKFYGDHRITVSAEYTGERYDDLQNQHSVGDYFLLNTRLDLQLNPNFTFFLGGNNLLNLTYEIYRGFEAPGVTGYAGLKIVM